MAERAAVAGLLEIRPRRERARLACSSSVALLGEGAGPSLPIRRSPLAPVASGYLAGRVIAVSPRLPPPPPPAPSRRAAGPRAAPAPFRHWICDIEGRSFLAPRAVETRSSTASHLLPPAASPPPPAYLQVLVEGPDAVSLAAVVEGRLTFFLLRFGVVLPSSIDFPSCVSPPQATATPLRKVPSSLVPRAMESLPQEVSDDRIS